MLKNRGWLRRWIAFPEWQARHVYAEGDLVRWSGGRYRVAKKLWRGDRGLDWNPGRHEVGEEVVNIEGNVYRCTASSGAGAPLADWGRFPGGTGDAVAEDQGNFRYVWRYVVSV